MTHVGGRGRSQVVGQVGSVEVKGIEPLGDGSRVLKVPGRVESLEV